MLNDPDVMLPSDHFVWQRRVMQVSREMKTKRVHWKAIAVNYLGWTSVCPFSYAVMGGDVAVVNVLLHAMGEICMKIAGALHKVVCTGEQGKSRK